jgi:hypothetical protein
MLKVKRVLGLAGILVLVLGLLFGCARLFWNDDAQSGWYIRLNIGYPGAKAIGVGEYDVTGLSIAVYDPGDQLLDAIEWDAVEGPKSYVVQVNQAGTHHIEVTHFGDNNGEVVEANESAEFNIQPTVITVIDVTPGMVGLIRVDGEVVSDPFAWLHGYWIQDEYAAPTSDYLEIREDGTYWWWINYDGSGGIDESGTWYVDSGLLIIVMEGMEVPTEVVKLSDDEFNLIMFGEEEHFYRKGTEPYWVFDLPSTPLTVSSDWTERIINDDEVQLFTFQAPVSGTYGISWKQVGDPDLPDYSAGIDVFAYRSDQETLIFGKEMSGYPAPMLVLLDMDETIYIVVEMDIAGTYGIRVLQPVP